jgi:Xaa-Pro dipeptidase
MSYNRRKFIGLSALTAGAMTLKNSLLANTTATPYMANGIAIPITIEERKARIAKAQLLMAKEKIDAIFLEGNVSCFYFTGLRWGQSERTFGVVIPAKGAIAYVCPKFEEDRARELIQPVYGEEGFGSLLQMV